MSFGVKVNVLLQFLDLYNFIQYSHGYFTFMLIDCCGSKDRPSQSKIYTSVDCGRYLSFISINLRVTNCVL